MSASTFHEPVQLYDEQVARLAPFPALTAVRRRSSSLAHAVPSSLPLKEEGTTSSTAYSVWNDEAMPGILSKVLSKRSSLEATSIHKDTGGKLKITEKGRERRLSAGNWRARSSAASNDSNGRGSSIDHGPDSTDVAPTPIKQSTSSPSASSPSTTAPHDLTPAGTPLVHRRTSHMQLDDVTNLSRVPSSGAEEDDSSPSDTSITQQRARAYAALTGRGNSSMIYSAASSSQALPTIQAAAAASLDLIARASLSQPSLPSHQQAHYQPLQALDPNVVSTNSSSQFPAGHGQHRRRTTSNNDAPMNNESLSKVSMLPPNKTPRRSRVQSASAIPSSTPIRSHSPRPPLSSSSRASASASPSTPSGAGGARIKNRRSLSSENSLVATRIARAFLIRELGETSITRNASSNSTPSRHWNNNESEQKELWLALHDGVLLCRLLNQLIPDSIPSIDKRDLNLAKKANIMAFVNAARLHLPLQPHEFFDPDNLYSGSPSGFERVLHTLCSIAEYVALKQHGLFQTSILDASRSAESLLPPPELMLHIRAPSPSPPLSIHNASTASSHIETSSTSNLLSPVQRRLSNAAAPSVIRTPTLTSASGNKIRSRTTSRITSTPVSSSRAEAANASPNLSSEGPSSLNMDQPTNESKSLNNVPPTRTYQNAVYGNNSDKRMCESAVEIMSVVREGDETPNPRRTASDRPQEWKGGGVLTSSPECTPTKRAAEKGYPGLGYGHAISAFNESEAVASSSERLALQEFGLPIPNTRAIRLKQSIGSSGSGSTADVFKGNSPRIVRKRLSADRPVPIRSKSTSPSPISSSPSGTIPNVPFPQAPPLLIRARTSVGPAGEDINEDTEVSSMEEGEGDDEHIRKERTTSADPNDDFLLRPRQHKRWHSEVHETSAPGSRLYQEAAVPNRTRHNSFMPSSSGQKLNDDSPRPSGDFRRRGVPDRRQSMDASRQRLVVREAGKMPITYQLGECIGRGQFGSVYRALNIHTGGIVAVKRIRLAGKTEEEANQLQKEVDLLKRLSHPSVVKYEGLVRTEHYLNIVMEYVENGSLHNTLAAFGILPEALVASYVVKILEGLSYLHRMQVIHRDLKAANILTTKKGNIKLSDFGVSLQLNAVHNTIENADATGTPNWMAPEVIKLEKATHASDIWSLACTVIELLTGRPPYANMLAMTAMFKIVEDDMPPLPQGSSPELQDFLGLCFAKDPRQRPSADALFEHVWLRKHWNRHKQTLRAQDSIPFFRRISSEYRRPQFDQQDSPASETLPELDRSVSSPCHSSLLTEDVGDMQSVQDRDNVTIVDALECRPHSNNGSISNRPIPDLDAMTSEVLRQGKDVTTTLIQSQSPEIGAYPFPQVARMPAQAFQSPVSPNPGPSHSFAKASFSKPIECKLCHKPVKKYAVLCEDCGLICHASCKEFAPISCDLRSQLLGLSIPPSFAAQQAAPQVLGVSAPTVEPSPLTSPSQFAFHSRFGIGKSRRPRASPASEEASSSAEGSPGPQSPDSPRRHSKGIALLRSRTQSPEGVGYHYNRPRPASYASSGSFPRSHEMHQGSMSSSSDCHPLSSSSIPEEGLAPSSPPVLSPSPLHQERRIVSAPNPSLKPPKHTRSKSMKRQSGTDCTIS